jgi:tetratricopeptide (TPR) repeat protein
VYAIRGGFLLVPAAKSRAIPGSIRLRRLAGDLFIPVDSDLLPALLPDEAASLTRDRGLIVLPGSAVHAFDATAPLPVARWLAPTEVRRAEWRPFPQRPDFPDTLTVIERPAPPVIAIVELLGAGAPDDVQPLPGPGEGAGEAVPDDARPPSGSLLGRTAAGTGLAVAGFLAWLGRQFGAAGLARLGGDLARRALERVPRLSERLLGEQEAALREVLRQLQSGDVEKGLRRAPTAVPDPDRPARVGTDARLTSRDPRYSLRDLIGSGGNAGAIWLGGGDVWAELAREYRRLAGEATVRGDHRRAAYLYGVLLRDLRAAANALMSGGLFRDAALLFRDRLNDPRAAAEAFDRSGDHDEALRLYDRLGEYERAADLLRLLGEEERAVRYYTLAAARLVTEGRFLAAGNLMGAKACRYDIAAEHYRSGWLGGGAEAVTCAERLIEGYLLTGNRPALEALLTEVETLFADRPREAGRLFNYALCMSEDYLATETLADLADRVRLLFASHLRASATTGDASTLVGTLFQFESYWSPPVGRDATFAARNRTEVPTSQESTLETLVRLIEGPVTAVTVIRGTFDLLVSGAGGIVCWRVAEGRIVTVTGNSERVTALATSARGEVIYGVTVGADEKWRLHCYTAQRSGRFRSMGQYALDYNENDIYIQSLVPFRGGNYRVAVVTNEDHLSFVGPHVQPGAVNSFLEGDRPVRLLVEANDGFTWCWAGGSISCGRTQSPDETVWSRWTMPWMPAGAVDWLTPAPGTLEVVGVDSGGWVRWETFAARTSPRTIGDHFAIHPSGYSVVCLVAPGLLAAATTGNEVHWLRVGPGVLIVVASARVGVPSRVFALSARPDANEVVAVLQDGSAILLRRS